jgi:hypothetical protein
MIVHYSETHSEDTLDLHHGKYDCPMAKYLSERVMMNGDYGDDEWSDGVGDGWARYGRFLLFWDDRGFVGCDKFPTVAAAVADRDQWLAEQSAREDEACREQGCEACRYCDRYDCGGCVEEHMAGSTHRIGCERDWIG